MASVPAASEPGLWVGPPGGTVEVLQGGLSLQTSSRGCVLDEGPLVMDYGRDVVLQLACEAVPVVVTQKDPHPLPREAT